MIRDYLFNNNSDIARDLVVPCAEFCPNAALGRTVNPVNSVFPAMELYKKKGLDPMKIVGITTLIPAGMPRSPGITRDELFKINSDIARDLVDPCAEFCPNAALGRTVNPVNGVLPAMAELYKKMGLDPLKIVYITTLTWCAPASCSPGVLE